MKKQKRKTNEIAFTVIGDRRTRDKLRVLGAMSGIGMGREAGRRLAESVEKCAVTLGFRREPT
jgi:hypothetical protein